MHFTRRIAALATAATLALGAGAAPVLAAGSSHWSKSQCNTWKAAFLKRNPHPSKVRKASANKALSLHGCSVRVK